MVDQWQGDGWLTVDSWLIDGELIAWTGIVPQLQWGKDLAVTICFPGLQKKLGKEMPMMWLSEGPMDFVRWTESQLWPRIIDATETDRSETPFISVRKSHGPLETQQTNCFMRFEELPLDQVVLWALCVYYSINGVNCLCVPLIMLCFISWCSVARLFMTHVTDICSVFFMFFYPQHKHETNTLIIIVNDGYILHILRRDRSVYSHIYLI